MRINFAIFFLVISLNVVNATGWVSPDGREVPNTDSMKSINDFGGWLLVTPDLDWKEKWDTPAEVSPNFRTADKVKHGDDLAILIFYINPKLDGKNEMNILCDITATRPDGSVSVSMKDIQCASGKIEGDIRNVRLSNAVINYSWDDGDPAGIWIIDVKLTDKNRNTVIPLKTQFELLAPETEFSIE